jgi:carboxypeptidase Taq
MVEAVQEAYEGLIRRSRELELLSSCSALLGWDEQTYMPEGGAAHRGEQMALLAGLHHERATDPRIGELLASLEASGLPADPDSPPAVNIRELRRSYDRKTRLPRGLVEELARTTSLAQQEWVGARREASFDRFRPWLEKIILLKRDEAACLGAAEGTAGSPLDPLLDEYEPGARVSELSVLFRELRDALTPLVRAIGEAAARSAREGEADAILLRSYPLERQKIFGEAVAAAVGFDFRRGRLDVTAHPFCTGIGPGDTRITTRYDEHQLGDSFFGILHEVGHGLYEQGLPAEHAGTPMGESVSLGVHESQSRLWENAVGRSRAFWSFWFPLARRIFHAPLRDVSLDQFLAAVNHVAPSLIRVRADEVTYNLHIILRFELEQALVSGDLPVGDLPAAWNEKYRDPLGITPANDREGCLQDIHWSAGLLGYFPTYTLGNIYAAQLYDRARSELAGLEASFARGDYAELLSWLRDKVHRHGRRYRPASLIERAAGAMPDHRPLIRTLKDKYGEIYGL